MKLIEDNSSFSVRVDFTLSQTDQEVLSLLYLPLIKSDSLSLYNTLFSLGHLNEAYIEHTYLLKILGLNSASFLRARSYLESIGLLETYRKSTSDKDAGKSVFYVYKIIPPATPKKFFDDILLRTLLNNVIGGKNYFRLKNYFKVDNFKLDDEFVNISDSFKNNYDVEVSSDNVSIDDNGEESIDKSYKSQNEFSANKLKEIFKKNRVKISTYKEDFNSIVSLASIYGLSEDETYELVIKNTDIDQKFYINGFSKDIKRIKKFKVDKSDNSNVDQGDSNTAFSKYLRVFNNVTPVEFLATRFNCNPPKFMIDELTILKEDFGLNNSVINVVLDYSIKQTKGVFNQTFIEKVAATISENNIQDAYQAMVALNSRDFEKGKRKSKASEMKEKHVNNDSEIDERKEDDLSDLKDFYDL